MPPSEVNEIFTLAAGSNKWSDLLAAINSGAYAGMSLQHAEFTFNVEFGGPVALVQRTTAPTLITEGKQYNIGDGITERASDKGCIDGAQIYFFATGTDTVSVYARNR